MNYKYRNIRLTDVMSMSKEEFFDYCQRLGLEMTDDDEDSRKELFKSMYWGF